jgi:hypothetical protein
LRDILTALAFLVILVLSVALAVPPFIDWEARRGDLEAAMSRAAGVPIETRGEIDLRLLPSPRLRVDGLTLGIPDGDALSLVAQDVLAELELTGLLRGEVRFQSVSIRRANLRVPSDSGTIRLPDAITAPEDALGAWALDDLRVSTLGITEISADLGIRHLTDLRDVVVSAQNLAGPWRVDGLVDGQPFRLATGRLDPDGRMQLKLVGGGDAPVRYDIDAILALEPEGDRFRTHLSGAARIVVTPPPGASGDAPLPVVVETGFASESTGVALADLGIEFGDPGLGSRLEGSGFLRLDDPRLGLQLEGRRLAADAILAGPLGRFLREQAGQIQGSGVPVDLTLALGSIGLAQEELLDVALDVTLDQGVAQFHDAQVTLPGASRLTFSGDVDLADVEAIEGTVSLRTEDSDRLARFLRRVGLDGPWMGVLQGQSLDVSGIVSLAPSVYAIRELAFQAGASVLSGEITYREPDGARRGLVEARIVADGIDISALPQFDRLTDLSGDTDLALTVEANAVRFEGDEGAGRIVANISSDGSTIIVDALEIVDLAGATVEVSGRISEDGGGLISGTLAAARAAPLLELLGRFWGEGFADAVPQFLRRGAVDVALFIERVPAARGLDTAAFQTSVEGQVAGGPFQADVTTIAGRTESVSISLATDDTRAWLDLDHPLIVGRPSALTLDLRRAGSDRFAANFSGDVAGLRVQTTRPFSIDTITREIWDGEVNIAAGDARPAMALFGQGDGSGPPIPADLRLSVTRDGASSILSLGGRIAGDPFRGRIEIPGAGAMSGQFEVAELSLPWIIDTLALGIAPGGEAGQGWSRAAFSAIQRPVNAGRFGIEAARMTLADELALTGASVDIELTSDGIVVSNLEGSIGDGFIAGEMTLRRTSATGASMVGEVSFANLPLAALEQAAPFDARVTGTIDFGGSGESVAGLVANLAGGGNLEVQGLSIPRADPEGILRGLDRALLDEDPLGGRRLQGLVEEELEAGSMMVEQLSAPITLVGGVIRLDPLNLDPGIDARAEWSGNAAFDLNDGSIEARGLMRARAAPTGWSGTPPTIGLGWAGPLASPERSVDVGPLTNGVASIVLQRELDRIEAFEREANERARRMEQLRMERARQEDAARWQEVLRIRAEEEEARRQEEETRLAEEARIAEEARLEQERLAEEARVAEEARLAEEALLAEEARLAEDARLAEEEALAREEEEQRLLEERLRLESQRAEEREMLRRLSAGEAEGVTGADESDAGSAPLPISPPLQLLSPGTATQ